MKKKEQEDRRRSVKETKMIERGKRKRLKCKEIMK
jgi:hypothetical protein